MFCLHESFAVFAENQNGHGVVVGGQVNRLLTAAGGTSGLSVWHCQLACVLTVQRQKLKKKQKTKQWIYYMFHVRSFLICSVKFILPDLVKINSISGLLQNMKWKLETCDYVLPIMDILRFPSNDTMTHQ